MLVKWTVDARHELPQTIALIVLRAVRVARPKHQHERLSCGFKHRQYCLRRDVGEVGLLLNVSHIGSGCFPSPTRALSSRAGAAFGNEAICKASSVFALKGRPPGRPVRSSMMIVSSPDRSVTS